MLVKLLKKNYRKKQSKYHIGRHAKQTNMRQKSVLNQRQ